jgi:hypothetical protein
MNFSQLVVNCGWPAGTSPLPSGFLFFDGKRDVKLWGTPVPAQPLRFLQMRRKPTNRRQ